MTLVCLLYLTNILTNLPGNALCFSPKLKDTVFLIKSSVHRQDDEDQAYLMDDAGNIEPSQAPKQDPQSTVCPGEEPADVWGDAQDDQDYLESLDDFEQNSGDISDQLLLQCMADFDSQ